MRRSHIMTTATSIEDAERLAAKLLKASISFAVKPMPFDCYEFQTKEAAASQVAPELTWTLEC